MRVSLACLIAVAGCGDDAGALPDAPLPVDGARPDASGPMVTLTITDGDVPAVGATVYFQNPDSSLVAKVMTDADGVASAAMPDGGYVTAIEPRAPVVPTFGEIVLRDRLSTFAGVVPGDELHLDLRPVPAMTSVTFTVMIPEDTDPDVTEHRLYTPCGSVLLGGAPTSTPSQVTLVGCGAVTDLVVVNSNKGSQPLRASFHADQAIAEGAEVVLTGPYTDVTPLTVDITGSPAWAFQYQVEIDVRSPRGRLFPVFATLEAAAPSGMLGVPALTGTTALVRADLFAIQPGIERQTVLAWGVPYGAQTLDMGTRALRSLTSTPVFDPATRTLAWTDGAGRTPDIVRGEIYTYRDGAPSRAWHWQMIAPYAGTALTYPVLQGDAATTFTTTAGDSFSVTQLETLALEGGYDRIRSQGLRRTLDAALPGPPGELSYQRLEDPNLLVPFTTGTR